MKNKIDEPKSDIEKDRKLLAARASALISSLAGLEMEPADNKDEDLRYIKGPLTSQRKRLTFFDRCDITNTDNEHRITIATRGPDQKSSGAAICLHDKSGKVRVAIAVNDNDQPSIQLLGANRQCRMMIGLGKGDQPIMLFFDKSGREVFGLTDMMARWGAPNKPDTVQIERKAGDAHIRIGKTCFIGTVDGQPAVTTMDKTHTMSVGITADKQHGEIGIIRKKKTLWSATSAREKAARKREIP